MGDQERKPLSTRIFNFIRAAKVLSVQQKSCIKVAHDEFCAVICWTLLS